MTRRIVICEAGDIAVVPFPFTDMAVSKYRPALVLTDSKFNEENGSSILAMITTARRSSWPTDVALIDPAAAGLAKESYVRWKLFTLPNDLLKRSPGRVGPKDRVVVFDALRRILPA